MKCALSDCVYLERSEKRCDVLDHPEYVLTCNLTGCPLVGEFQCRNCEHRQEGTVLGNTEKVVTTFAQISVRDIGGRNYYEIVYFDNYSGEFHTGFGSYSLPVVKKWLRKEFIVNDTPEKQYALIHYGKWLRSEDGYFCSECGHSALWEKSEQSVSEYCSDICPYCGAHLSV